MKQTANTIGAAVDAIEELLSEIERYLGAIELFRALGHEPSWRPELRFEYTAARAAGCLELHESHVSGA